MKPEIIADLRRRLLAWFDQNRRPLPWREISNPYQIWVSEVMLQQTQVQTVIPFYRAFIERFPDIETLARADLDEVLKKWEGLGYYARARHLHQAAQQLTTRPGGCLPAKTEALRRLPGIGVYIAAAVANIAFGEPVAAVDGNVKRVLARLSALLQPVNLAPAHAVFQEAANELLDRSRPGDFNQAMMELGALICHPRKPVCTICPVQIHCQAFQNQVTDRFPCRLSRPPVPTYQIATGVVMKADRFLITRRKPEGLLGGLWEFPGGKLQPGETAAEACLREIREETALKVEVQERLIRIRHAYTHFRIVMDVFRCQYLSGRIRLNGPADYRWIGPEQIDAYAFPKANHAIFPLLKRSP